MSYWKGIHLGNNKANVQWTEPHRKSPTIWDILKIIWSRIFHRVPLLVATVSHDAMLPDIRITMDVMNYILYRKRVGRHGYETYILANVPDCNFNIYTICLSKCPPAAILEVRFAPKTIGFFHYVLSMAIPYMKLIGEFMTKLEQPQTFWAFLYKMAIRGHFVFPIDWEAFIMKLCRSLKWKS